MTIDRLNKLNETEKSRSEYARKELPKQLERMFPETKKVGKFCTTFENGNRWTISLFITEFVFVSEYVEISLEYHKIKRVFGHIMASRPTVSLEWETGSMDIAGDD